MPLASFTSSTADDPDSLIPFIEGTYGWDVVESDDADDRRDEEGHCRCVRI
jgi:hypothetical protein